MPATVTLSVTAGHTTRDHVFTAPGTCLVGRAAGCDIRIDDAGVSGRHCRLDIDPPLVRVRDMGSDGGTHVNGVRLGRLTEPALGDGDEIRLGGAVVRVAVSAAEPAAAPPVPRPDAGAVVSAMLRAARAGDPALGAFRDHELVRELGRGAQGVVHLVRHTGSGELIALKTLFARVSVDPAARFAFLREVESIDALRHPNIVEARGSGAAGDEFHLAFEYCPGGNVEHLVERRGGRLAPDEAVPIALQVLDALAYAHEAPVRAPLADGRLAAARGLVHRDIKPPNILLADGGGAPVAKLADFGLAKAFDRAGLSGHTHTGAIGGTMPFMARSQLVDYRFAGPEVDVWAVAACLYLMLTGATPRDFPAGRDPIAVVLREPVVPVRDRLASVPPRLAAVLDEALAEHPAITTAAGLARALAAPGW